MLGETQKDKGRVDGREVNGIFAGKICRVGGKAARRTVTELTVHYSRDTFSRV